MGLPIPFHVLRQCQRIFPRLYLPKDQFIVFHTRNRHGLPSVSYNPNLWDSSLYRAYSTKEYIPTVGTLSSNSNDLSRDILLEKIKSSTDTGEIFESLKLHLSIMNPSHQYVALQTLFQLDKAGSSKISKENIINSKEFQKLCKHLVRNLSTFRIQDVLSILKILNYFKVSTKSKIMQTCLQLITSNVNSLNLANIMFLDYILINFKSCPLVDALKISLPIVFQAQYTNKIHYEHTTGIIEMFAFATRRNLSNDCINKIIETLIERDIDYNEKLSKSIILSIIYCKSIKQEHRILLNKTLNWICLNINKFKYEDIELLTYKLVNKYVWMDDMFYNEMYLNHVCQYLISNDINFGNSMNILKKLARIHFVDIPLLEHIAVKAYMNPSILEKIQPGEAISFVSALSDSCFKPPNWELIHTYILHNFENLLTNDKVDLPWSKISLEFASLDVWPLFLYEKIFNPNFLEKYVRENNVLDYLQILFVYQIYQTMCPNPNQTYILPNHLVEKAVQYLVSNEKEDIKFQIALEKGFGGKEYIKNKVFTKYNHCIDYLIAMRKGGFPIPIQHSVGNSEENSICYLEDIKADLPEGSYMIAICAMPTSAYTLNIQKMRGMNIMNLKSIETCGVSVLPINIDKWELMPEHERIPYLMQVIRTRESEEDTLTNHINL